MLRVYLLGRLTLLAPEGEVILPTAKTRLLAAYLFWQQGRWVRREALRGMLWEEADEERAAANLRQALHSLRQALKIAGLPDGLLEVRRDAVRVPTEAECWVDGRAFEEKARTGLQPGETATEPLMTAASLYRGDFLEEMDADWCLAERRRLADTYLGVLRALVERLAAARLHQAALSYAHRWLAADPLDEAAHRALMRLYAAMGQPAQVVEQFAQCRRVLETELGVAPGDETVRLYREISLAGDERTAGRKRRVKRPRPVEQLSEDPLRNARMLLAYGEAMVLQGESGEGIAALEKALKVYERFGSTAVKARLVLGEALLWLSIPLTPRVDQALRLRALHYIEQALERYPVNGPPADFVRALQLGSQINWLVGRNNRAVELAEEGMAIAHALGDREAETRLAVLLAMALRESYRLREADAAFERAVRGVPCLTNLWEVLWLVMQRGILAYIVGDLAEAESFLREALSLGRMAPFPSLMLKVGDTMTRSMLIVILHYRDKRAEMKELLPPPEAEKFNPEPYTYLKPALHGRGPSSHVAGPGRLAARAAGKAAFAHDRLHGALCHRGDAGGRPVPGSLPLGRGRHPPGAHPRMGRFRGSLLLPPGGGPGPAGPGRRGGDLPPSRRAGRESGREVDAGLAGPRRRPYRPGAGRRRGGRTAPGKGEASLPADRIPLRRPAGRGRADGAGGIGRLRDRLGVEGPLDYLSKPGPRENPSRGPGFWFFLTLF